MLDGRSRWNRLPRGSGAFKTAQVIPDDELWLHTPNMRASLDKALEWSAGHQRTETDLNAMASRLKQKK